uniref:Uncharacterized protein n=1 Tax=Panagrolaimus superbus TaxID=310955 RepID=A0A914YWT6_9BILA
MSSEKAARRASRRVFKRPKLTNSQRAAYYGYSEFIKNESDSDETTTADEKMQVHESSNRSSQFETSKAFIISSNSALGILDKTKNAANTRDDEQEVLDHTTSYGPSETSKASISFSESVLNVFDKPRLRDATFYDDNENASKIFDDEIEENSTHVSNESQEIFEKSTVEYMEEENEYATKISFDREGTPKITTAYPEETPEMKSPCLKKLAEAAAPVAKEPITTLSQPVKTRAALLLPRFMQQTNASSSRTNRPPVMCSSPVRGKKFVPLPSPKLRAPLTPRKSVAVLRKVADQSFNAAKLPVLDMALFEDIPKKIITDF